MKNEKTHAINAGNINPNGRNILCWHGRNILGLFTCLPRGWGWYGRLQIRHNIMMWGLPRQDHWDHEGERWWKSVCVGGRGGDGAKHAESMQWHILMVYLNFLAYLIFSPPIYQPSTKLVRELIKQVYFTKSIA